MPTPRKQQISLAATPYYHCVSRCVRRAFLCGFDKATSTSYEHRRDWVEARLTKCATVFCINVASYAIMHNHYHVVLHINEAEATALTDFQVIERWHQLFAGTELTTDYLKSSPLNKAQLEAVKLLADEWRKRLMDISWFMRGMNEPIARRANAEDDCTGRFWEGRFKCQALLDNVAVLACMAYVDLNPIRAKVNKTPETSDFTSIQRRIKARIKAMPQQNNGVAGQPVSLMPFIGGEWDKQPIGINYNLDDYLSLVDTTGRAIIAGKRGVIDANLSPILSRLAINPERWLILTTQFEQQFKQAAGSINSMKRGALIFNKRWLQGQNKSAYLIPN